VLREAASRDSYIDVIRQHAYRGLAEARDESAIPLLLEGAAWGRISQGRRAAIGAVAQLVKGRRDREARDVRERVEHALEDKDFRVQAAAIEALSVIGDPAAVAPLRKVIVRELDGRLRRRAAEVIRDLEDGRGRDEELGKLRDEVGQLRDTLVKLKDQVERLQVDRAHEKARAGGDEKPKKKKKKK
jgi:aminopeptidase N